MYRGWVVGVLCGLLLVSVLTGVAFAGKPTAPHPSAPTPSGSNSSASDWSTYLHDAQRSGSARSEVLLSNTSVQNLQLAWSAPTKSVIAAAPDVVGDHVYVGSWDGYFYAFNLTGGFDWKSYVGIDNNSKCAAPPIPRGVTSTATVVGGVVYVGGGDAALYALNATTGHQLWRVPLGSITAGYYLWASPVVIGNHLYIGTASDCDRPLVHASVVEISIRTHAILHRTFLGPTTDHGASVWASPTIDGTTRQLYVVTGNAVHPDQFDDSVVELNDSTLNLTASWHLPASQTVRDGDFGATPTIVTRAGLGDLVVATNKNGITYAWNASNVALGPLWEKRISNGGADPEKGEGDISPAAFSGKTVFVGGEAFTANQLYHPGSVAALDPTNGSILWRTYVPGYVLAAVTVANGLVLAASNGTLSILSATNGTPLWNTTPSVKALFYGAPVVSNGCVFEGSTDGKLYAWGVPGAACRTNLNHSRNQPVDPGSPGWSGVLPSSGTPSAVVGRVRTAMPVRIVRSTLRPGRST
jgi:outer membrane protein assembly factor BamB